MSTANDIVLRPRFKIELEQNNESALKAFEAAKTEQSEFIISRIDDHVFIKLPKEKQHFWSPQLHLEINELDNNRSTLRGLFGPNPTVWTLFMFLHFMVIGIFIAFAIWAYSNWALKTGYALQVWGMVFMVVIWFALYLGGRAGRTSSRNEMMALHKFMNRTLKRKPNYYSRSV